MSDRWVRPPIPTKSTLVNWSRKLELFRYYRHFGHSTIEDEMVVALENRNVQQELRDKLATICQKYSQILRINVFDDRTLIGLTDTHGLAVTELSIETAVEAEKTIKTVPHAILDPPINDRNCYSPKNHPEIWGIPV